jgi:hypothetical protein
VLVYIPPQVYSYSCRGRSAEALSVYVISSGGDCMHPERAVGVGGETIVSGMLVFVKPQDLAYR